MNPRKIFWARKLKGWFLRFQLHRLVLPFATGMTYLAYMAHFSKWRKAHSDLPFNDFYNGKVRYEDRFKLHQFVLEHEQLAQTPIQYMEFGVANAVAMRWWLTHSTHKDSQFFGFDVFTGLPEDFGLLKKGDYDRGGTLPNVNGDARCQFVVGLFQKTLGNFLKNHKQDDRRCVYHLDADLYSSTLFVLTMLADHFKPGDILIFDEFGVPLHEFRAFHDFFDSYYRKYEVLGAVNNYLQIAIRIL